jgi:hypothetical protein
MLDNSIEFQEIEKTRGTDLFFAKLFGNQKGRTQLALRRGQFTTDDQAGKLSNKKGDGSKYLLVILCQNPN